MQYVVLLNIIFRREKRERQKCLWGKLGRTSSLKLNICFFGKLEEGEEKMEVNFF